MNKFLWNKHVCIVTSADRSPRFFTRSIIIILGKVFAHFDKKHFLSSRWPLLIFFATSGLAGVVYGFISPEWPLTVLSVGLIGRMMVNAAYFICLQYGSEIFPTVIRGQGVALCEIVGGFAIFLSPTVVYLVNLSQFNTPVTRVSGQGVSSPTSPHIRSLLHHRSPGHVLPARDRRADPAPDPGGRGGVRQKLLSLDLLLSQAE